MTTVVVDRERRLMVSENQATTNSGEMMAPCTKLFWCDGGPHDGDIIGMTGHEGPSLFFVEWWMETEGRDCLSISNDAILDINHDLEDFECILLSKGRILVVDRFFIPYEIDLPFYAGGSGAQYAMGAMAMGSTAEEAVNIACRFDPSSSRMGRSLQIIEA